jgi:hypothetical protein
VKEPGWQPGDVAWTRHEVRGFATYSHPADLGPDDYLAPPDPDGTCQVATLFVSTLPLGEGRLLPGDVGYSDCIFDTTNDVPTPATHFPEAKADSKVVWISHCTLAIELRGMGLARDLLAEALRRVAPDGHVMWAESSRYRPTGNG